MLKTTENPAFSSKCSPYSLEYWFQLRSKWFQIELVEFYLEPSQAHLEPALKRIWWANTRIWYENILREEKAFLCVFVVKPLTRRLIKHLLQKTEPRRRRYFVRRLRQTINIVLFPWKNMILIHVSLQMIWETFIWKLFSNISSR